MTTSTYKIEFTDEAGNVTATGKEYKSKGAATRAGNKAVKDSPKPITFLVIEKVVSAADAKAAKKAAALIAAAKKAPKATPAPAIAANPAKAPEADVKPVETYSPGTNADTLKAGTVAAVIVETTRKKALSREEIIVAVIATGWAPQKSAAFAKNPGGYLRGYLSSIIGRKQLIAA